MGLLTLLWSAVAVLGLLLLLGTLGLRRFARRLERMAQRTRLDANRLPLGADSDALAAAWFYLRPGDVPQGPVGLTALRAMAADGRLTRDALAAPAGSNDWQPLCTLLVDEPAARPRARLTSAPPIGP